MEKDLAGGQHRNPDPADRPEFFATVCFRTPDGLAQEIGQAGFADVAVYGPGGPGWPPRRGCDRQGRMWRGPP